MDLSIDINLALDSSIQLLHAYYEIPMSGIRTSTATNWLLVSIDLKKAFDTADTKILLEKLAHCGIRKACVDLEKILTALQMGVALK